MSWLKTAKIDPLDQAISLSVLEEMFEPEEGVVEIERFIPGLRDYTEDPAVRFEIRETLEKVYKDIKEGRLPNELYEVEHDLFKKYVKEHPDEIQEHGLDTVHDLFRAKFVRFLQKDFLDLLESEIERT